MFQSHRRLWNKFRGKITLGNYFFSTAACAFVCLGFSSFSFCEPVNVPQQPVKVLSKNCFNRFLEHFLEDPCQEAGRKVWLDIAVGVNHRKNT